MKAAIALVFLVTPLVACGPDKDQRYEEVRRQMEQAAPAPVPKVRPPPDDGQEAPLVGHYQPTPDDPPPFPDLVPPEPPSGGGVVAVELVDSPPASINPLTGPPASELPDYSAYGDLSHYTRYSD